MLVLCVQVLFNPSLRFLAPPQYSGDEWNFSCGAHNIKLYFNKFNSNMSFQTECPCCLDKPQKICFLSDLLSTEEIVPLETVL